VERKDAVNGGNEKKAWRLIEVYTVLEMLLVSNHLQMKCSHWLEG
jgi:hypothetical protein